MPARREVLLTAQGSDPRLLPTILLESTLIGMLQVFILNNLKPFRMNKVTKDPHFAQFWCSVTPFRINTCKSVSKQMTLTTFRINTYEKRGGGGYRRWYGPGRSLTEQTGRIPDTVRAHTCRNTRAGVGYARASRDAKAEAL